MNKFRLSLLAAVALGSAAPAQAGNGIITTITGNGEAGSSGDGGDAKSAQVSFPIRAVTAPDGSILIADEGNNVIRQILPYNGIKTVAGVGGNGSFSGDGGPATSAHLNQPTGIGPLQEGGFLIADRSNNRIRKVATDGTITTVAGTGAPCANPAGACGDGGPATSARLNGPDRAVAFPDGSFLITEDQGHKVRKVSAAGVISRVAGTGTACPSPTNACGDGGAATSAQLNAPNGIAVLSDGGFVISDSNDNRVRMISAAGVITTIAGNGVAGSFGDGVRATSANLNGPSSVAVAPDGAIVITDTNSHLVRVVSGGVIRNLAGTADTPCPDPTSGCGDGAAATQAKLNTPYDASVTEDGYTLIADHLDQRVRRVNSTLGGRPTIRVLGRRLVNGVDGVVQLRGVNRAIYESRCTYDANGNADGPANQASIDAMLGWKIDVVRVSFNEDCWLGINGLPKSGNAAAYRTEVLNYVGLLSQNRLYVILENHVTAPGTFQSNRIDNMPDREHAVPLWRSVSNTFKYFRNVIFDPINEAAIGSNAANPQPPDVWACWRNGCQLDSVYGGRFTAAGIQNLVGAIRSQGATQPIILGGIAYNSDLSELLTHLPNDPQRQLLASTHIYDFTQSNPAGFFTSTLEPIAARIPVILGELGERNCDSGTAGYTSNVLSLIDGETAKGNIFGMLGWTWNAKTAQSTGWHCPTGRFGDGGPLLIRDYTGTPTIMGGVIRGWVRSKAGNP